MKLFLESFLFALVLAVVGVLVPPYGEMDTLPRLVCVLAGAGFAAGAGNYIRESRKSKQNYYRDAGLVPRCGVPLVGGDYCQEPASPGCCYCELHANWPEVWKGGA